MITKISGMCHASGEVSATLGLQAHRIGTNRQLGRPRLCLCRCQTVLEFPDTNNSFSICCTDDFTGHDICLTHEVCNEGRCRRLIKITRTALLRYIAVFHDNNCIGYCQSFILVVGNINCCETKTLL
ncbi:hypothetical protein D9M72_581500 [compost metagenome]